MKRNSPTFTFLSLFMGFALTGTAQTDKPTTTNNPHTSKSENIKEPTESKPNSTYSLNAVDSEPVYPGGSTAFMHYIINAFQYPETTETELSILKLRVQFVVEKDGQISNVKIIQGSHPEFDTQIKKILQNSKPWKAGMQGGKLVRSQLTMPITIHF